VFIMSAIAEAVINVAAEAAAHVPARMLRRRRHRADCRNDLIWGWARPHEIGPRAA
jgi:hypothetical protein